MSATTDSKSLNGHAVLNSLTLNNLALEPLQDNRFYPEQLPSFEHEPTRDRFAIQQVGQSVGEGVVTLTEFAAGEIVFACSGFFSDEVTLFSLQITPSLHLHDPYFYGKLLHSCDPNIVVDVNSRQFIAQRDIKSGEYLTLDYARSEDYLFRAFLCQCGAANCRGIVAGRKQPGMEIVE